MKLYIIIFMILTMLIFIPNILQAETLVTVRLTIGHEEVLIDLLDNPAAKEFAAQLPLTLSFKDYVNAEKIATLPKRLTSKDSPSGQKTEASIDFTYFVPWGNLAIFYKGFGSDNQLRALGRIRTGKQILARQDQDFKGTLELVTY